MRENLVPVTITDKRGRTTTVYRKPSVAKTTSPKLPAVTTLPNAPSQQEKYKLAHESMQPAREKRRLAKEQLEAGTEEKDEIIGRFNKLYDMVGVERNKSFIPRRDTHYLESMRAMERLIAREPLDPSFMIKVGRIYDSSTGETFREWARLAERHYDAILDSPVADERTPANITGIVSACLSETDERTYNTGEALTEQQERNYLLLNLAALDSSLEGERMRLGGGYGVMTTLDNPDLMEFALTCTDDERLHRVCEVIKTTAVTRLPEALAIVDGDISAPLVNGVL
jgi:hypothetical protein